MKQAPSPDSLLQSAYMILPFPYSNIKLILILQGVIVVPEIGENENPNPLPQTSLYVDNNMNAELSEELDTPQDMQVSLMTHQKQALAWMANQEQGPTKGGILADAMGMPAVLLIC